MTLPTPFDLSFLWNQFLAPQALMPSPLKPASLAATHRIPDFLSKDNHESIQLPSNETKTPPVSYQFKSGHLINLASGIAQDERWENGYLSHASTALPSEAGDGLRLHHLCFRSWRPACIRAVIFIEQDSQILASNHQQLTPKHPSPTPLVLALSLANKLLVLPSVPLNPPLNQIDFLVFE